MSKKRETHDTLCRVPGYWRVVADEVDATVGGEELGCGKGIDLLQRAMTFAPLPAAPRFKVLWWGVCLD